MNLNHIEAFHLGQHSSVLQAEGTAVGKTAIFLIDKKIKCREILINCDI